MFLETITFLGNDVLIPINRIEYIMLNINEKGTYVITIKGEGKYEWVEHFSNNKLALERYDQIKNIIKAK